ncbi:MAG: hypothetical protein ACK2U9_06550, partial [Anaerolineae bacterium]
DPATRLRLPEGDLSTSSLEVSDTVADPGATLQYTVTVANTSVYTVSHPLIQADYPETLATVADPNGGSDDGDTLTWSTPDLAAGGQQVLTFTLAANTVLPPGANNLTVQAEIGSQLAPTVTLQINTVVEALPDLSASTMEASRAWAPPGVPVTITASLVNTGTAISLATVATLTLPSELGAPTWLTSTSSSLVYNPATHQATWTGDVALGTPEVLAFSSVVSSTLTACGQLAVGGVVADTLGQVTGLAATVNLVVPDVNCSGQVNVVDIQLVAGHWNTTSPDPGYAPQFDLDGNDVIDVLDLIIAGEAWNLGT